MKWKGGTRNRSRRSRMLSAVLGLALTTSAFGGNVAIPQAVKAANVPLTVYDDALSSEFVDYGWAEMDLAESGIVHSGASSIRMNPDGDRALYFFKDRIMDASDYEYLRFWVHGGETGGQQLKLVLSLSGQGLAELQVAELLPGGIPAGSWAEVKIKLSDVGVTGLLDGIWLWGQGDQESVYIDDMSFLPGSGTGTGGGTGTGTGGTGTGTGSGGTETPPAQPMTGIAFDQAPLMLREGGLRAAQLSSVHADGSRKELKQGVIWSSDDTAIASVSQGLVQGGKPGSTIIRAVYGSFEAVLPVQVLEAEVSRPIEPVDGIYVYSDSLNPQFTDYSWATRSMDDRASAHTGESSISFQPSGDAALYLYSDRGITTKDYEKLRLWVNGGESGGQKLRLGFNSGGQTVKDLRLDELVPGGLQAGVWSEVELQLADLELPGGLFDGLLIGGASGGEQGAVRVDDIALVRKYVEPPKLIEVRMNTHQMVLLPGESQRLDAESFFNNGETRIVTDSAIWASDRPDVVRVEQGALTAVAPGIAKITAVAGGFTAEAYVQVTSVAAEPVYAEGLADGFRNQSWHDKDLANREQAHGGQQSIKFNVSGWDGVWLVGNERQVADYYGFEFWVHGGTAGGQKLLFHAYDDTSSLAAVELDRYLPEGGLPAGQWTKVTVNFADLGLIDGEFDGMIFQAGAENNQGTMYIDDVSLLRNLSPGKLPMPNLPSVNVKVDTSANRKPINQEIYGINFNDMHANDSQLEFPVQRWGGNNTTRYNWELDVANRASDWYFINYPYDNDPAQLPHGSTSDRFIDETHAKNGKVLLTVPTIGWTPKDRSVTYGFSQKKYGPQQSGAEELPDAGNGVREDESLITGNDPLDTSKPIGPDFVTRWMDHIAGRTGDKVNYYALDNEPEIWHVTHRDVHPEAPTYDEIWGFTERYGKAIKDKDPDAQIFGPTSWGWCAYFYSSADNCSDGPDRQAHDGKPFLEWYLDQAADYKEETGVQLVDYLDIHFYPQENVVTSGDEGPYAAKRRYQSLKSLYDPNFTDDSWIQEPIRLIPRMKEMINSKLPGTKLAITEYNFGNGNGISAGLAQAEALAIFGREGVDLATRFGAMKAGTKIEDAFGLYLNYDGQGSKVAGTSVSATSSNSDAVGAYSIEGSDGKLFVLLFNKDTVVRSANVDTQGAGQQASLYRFDAKHPVSAAGQATAQADGILKLELPARSATLVVFQP
ncbi:Glycoside hydrolase family 44 [Paenibacillus sp. UNCCL117]|uniref:glycoside hydrolase family 44 protein n=1 Tax=unclassified Paenibacillus TaxID=185978 RepID=UPI00088669EB|nr:MULTISPECIES: glycoside hydrolase family 44 protein [unclassified Paenibacillus]SDE65884.1 Glycoside hydrolase family 44 [Paenibacillus sp. cl123]SFW70362.1 Glycoside hydrolase family 44 [Paenibacillus sp. UNCCL117]